MAESKHHTRLKNLLFNICSKVTRGLLPVLIQKLPKFHNMSVDQFVKHHKSKIQGYEIGKRNYYILFPTQQQPTDIQKWDLQLLCFIIVDILGQQQLHWRVVADVGALRTIRNALCHGPNTHISETNYTIYLQQIKGINKSFLNLIGDENLRKEIDVETDDFINDRQNIQEALGALKEWLEKDKDLQKEPCTLNEEQKQILTYLTSISENQKNIKIPDLQLLINIKNCNPEHEDTICRKFVDSVNEKVKESPLLLSQKDEVTAEMGRIVEKTFKEFFTDNQILVGAELGCVIIKVKSETFRSLEQLWTKCVNGELSQAFNTLQTYLRETYQNELEIEVMLPEIEFWEVIRKIVNDLKEKTSEKRNEESCLEGKVVNIIKRPSSDNGTDIEMVLRPKTQSELEYMRECETSGKLNESFRKMEGEFKKQLNLKGITINAKLSVQETRDQMSIPSTSGDYYRPPFKAVSHQAQTRDQTYLNWVRAGLGLKYTKEGTVSSVDGPDDFIKCRTARNEILHNPNQSLSDIDLTHYLNDMKATLKCTAALQNDVAAQRSVTKLTQLENSSFEITDEDITEVRRMALLAIKDKVSKQIEAIKEVGEKQKESVVSSVIQAEKRALDEFALETGRQGKVIKAEVDVYRRMLQKLVETTQQAATTQTDARYQEEKNMLELIYWRDVMKTGVVFGSMMFVLLSLACFSLLSVLAYLSLATLTVTFSFRVYKNVMQAVQKTNEGHPFQKLMDLDLDLKEEVVRNAAEKIANNMNNCSRELRRLYLVGDYIDSLRFGLLLWLLTYIGAWFNGMTLVILAVVSIFTLPKVYEAFQNVNLVWGQLNNIMAQTKVPSDRNLHSSFTTCHTTKG